MHIGIDIDGVLTNFEQWQLDVGSKYFLQYNKHIIVPNGYDSEEVFQVSKKMDENFWQEHLLDYAQNEPPRKYAAEVIQKWHEEGNTIFIITARELTDRSDSLGEQMRNIVRNWLEKHKIYFDKIIFSSEDKTEVCKKFHIDVMIEDKVDNIYKISSMIPVICYDASYNKVCQGKNIIRCYSWYDIDYRMGELKKGG